MSGNPDRDRVWIVPNTAGVQGAVITQDQVEDVIIIAWRVSEQQDAEGHPVPQSSMLIPITAVGDRMPNEAVVWFDGQYWTDGTGGGRSKEKMIEYYQNFIKEFGHSGQ